MSTKTSIKRVALVAVAALGFGMLTNVANATSTAAITTGTAAGDTTLTVVKPTNRVNVAGVYTVGFKAVAAADSTNAVSAIVRVALTKPAGSAATVTLAANAAPATGFNEMAVTGTGTNALTYTGDSTNTAASGADSLKVDATLNPDVVGTYSLLYYVDLNNNSAIDTGEGYYSQSVTVVADAPVVTISPVNSTAAISTAGADNEGSLVKISVSNAGAATSLSGTEILTITTSGGTGTVTSEVAGGGAAVTSLTRANFDSTGSAYLNVTDTAADTLVFTLSGTLGTTAIAQSTTLTFVTPTTVGNKEATTAISNTTGVGSASSTGASTGSVYVNSLKDTTVSYTLTGAATASTTAFGSGEYIQVTVKDTTAGLLTGTGAAYGYTTVAKFDTTGVASFSVTALGASTSSKIYTAPAIGATVTAGTVEFAAHTTNTQTVLMAKAGDNSITASQGNFRILSGGSVTVTAIVKDQFGIARAYSPVTAAISSTSRNYGATGGATKYLVTDANGYITFTYTDGPVSANVTLTSDVWDLTSTGVYSNATDGGAAFTNHKTASAATVVVASSITAGSVLVDTPNTTAGVANTTVTVSDIAAGSSGASASTVAVSAVVTDANGSVYAGVPVTFTVSGTGAAIPSNKVTVYTDSTGTATSAVYAWVAGTYTITATSATKTGTGSVTFGQLTATEARTIEVTSAGAIATATVKDRFGNGVKGATVYATKTGAGYFGNGLSSTSGTTDANGHVEFNIAGGAATVTVSLVDPTSPAGTTYGQSCAAAGFTSCASTATAILAYVAGTSVTAEKYVGNDKAAAGVASASVDVNAIGSSDAIDAANEATDAANAATDAANAAAEAADAATAAAQDAQAAVAALATSVASLIAGIKAQITTLTNLVIKIQKKIKA
jgi:hypothetical protein